MRHLVFALLFVQATFCVARDCFHSSRESCRSHGCVWMPVEGGPWCINPGTSPDIDCHPDSGASRPRCEKRDCVWRTSHIQNAPWCLFKPGVGYTAIPGSHFVSHGIDTSIQLNRTDTPSLFGNDFPRAYFCVRHLTDTSVLLSVRSHPCGSGEDIDSWSFSTIKDDGRLRRERSHISKSNKSKAAPQYKVDVVDAPFGFAVLANRSNGWQTLFDTRNISGLILARQFVSLTTYLPTEHLYGIGEQNHRHLKHDLSRYNRMPLMARDYAPIGDNMNLYGTYPFYLGLDATASAFGVVMRNRHPMSIDIQPRPPRVTFRAIGGDLDFVVYTGPTPDDVVRQFAGDQPGFGPPVFPPYWGLGFQISRFGTKNLDYVKKVYARNVDAKIPFDVQYVDIDYMDKHRDFTYDPVRFAGFPDFVDSLHEDNRKLVPIIDPGISADAEDTYLPLAEGNVLKVFIKNGSDTTKDYVGKCWPGNTMWPDFTAPNTAAWWAKQHRRFHKLIHGFDGVWYDMNEPSNMISGPTMCAANNLTKPPYSPVNYDNINDFTICLDAQQAAGKHYELHNVYGMDEVMVGHKALESIFGDKRIYILTRSSAPGTGRAAAHWTGDNDSSWPQLKWSIVGMLEFNMFGMPWVGSDVCGFNGETTEELCVRWHQLGAFYPFYRNHNTDDSKVDQDPAAWSPKAVDAIRKAIELRYKLLPHLYNIMEVSHRTGSPAVRPLFFQSPQDINTYDIDDQFLWGADMMVVPILTQGATYRRAYFPAGSWFDYESGSLVSLGGFTRLYIPYDAIGLFARAGSIIFTQEHGKNSVESRLKPMQVNIFVDPTQVNNATGRLFWDDGVTKTDSSSYESYELMATSWCMNMDTLCKVNFSVSDGSDLNLVRPLHIATINFCGFTSVCSADSLKLKFSYDEEPAEESDGAQFLPLENGCQVKNIKLNLGRVQKQLQVEVVIKTPNLHQQ